MKQGEKDERETAVSKHPGDEGKDQLPDKTKDKWAATREAVREGVAERMLRKLENIDMQELRRVIDEELDKLGWPGEEDVKRLLKWVLEFLDMNLDVKKLSVEEMEEEIRPLLEKKPKTNLPEFQKKFEGEFLPKLNRYIDEEVWPVMEREVNRRLDRLLGGGNEPKPQI